MYIGKGLIILNYKYQMPKQYKRYTCLDANKCRKAKDNVKLRRQRKLLKQAHVPIHQVTSNNLLREKDFKVPSGLTSKQMKVRSSLLGWWIKTSSECLEFRNRTVDVAIRLFDLYCWKKAEKQKKENPEIKLPHTLDSTYESKLTALTCFFTASKFQEIYPPCLSDFICYDEETINRKVVIAREMDLLYTIDANCNIALLQDWFEAYSNEELPEWAFSCYLHAPFASAQELGTAVAKIFLSGQHLMPCEAVIKVLQSLQ